MTAAGLELPERGTAFISVNEADKGQAVVLARKLSRLGFELMATIGTAARLREVGLEVTNVFKVNEDVRTSSIISSGQKSHSSLTRRWGAAHTLTSRRF